MMNSKHYKPCGCHQEQKCGCDKPNLCGCKTKTDFLCSFYSGIPLSPVGIEPGMDGNLVIKLLNDYIKTVLDEIVIDPTLIQSIGGKIPIYKGLSDAFVHEIKSIQGQPNGGVIVENIQATPGDCSNPGDYINVRIDEVWLRNWLISNICGIITEAGCGSQPVQNPVVTNVPISISNRATYTFTLADFTSHYTDPQSNPLASIRLTGNITGYRLNGVPYTVNTEITVADLNGGNLQYISNNVDTQYTFTTPYQAKSSVGSWSNSANIVVNVAAKIFISLSPVTVALIRSISNNKIATVNYTNGNGQTLTAGQVLHNTGTIGTPGYLKITVQNASTLTGTGSFTIVVDSLPTATQANQTVQYTIDGSTGSVNLTYNSNPVTDDVIVGLANRATHTFTTAEFLAKYTDFDSDAMVEMKAEGNVSNYLYNGAPYVSGTWIPVNNIAQLSYVGANIDTTYQQITPWFAKDSQGNIST